MAFPTLKRQASQGYASNTFIDATIPSVTDVTDGCVILVVTTRDSSTHSLLSGSGWFEMGQIARTSGAVGTTSYWGRYTTGSMSTPRIAKTGSALTWYATCIVIDGVETLPVIQTESLGTGTSSAAQTTTAITPPAGDTLVFGFFSDARTTTLSGTASSPAIEYVDSFNATYDVWHYAAYKQVSTPASTTVTVTPTSTASMREIAFAVQGYATNTTPSFTIQPTFATGRSYNFGPVGTIPSIGSGAGMGGTISFRATDAEETGANALSYTIRTSATPGAGTQIASGTCTSGITESVAVTNSTTGLTSNGLKTVYVHVSDGTNTAVSSSLQFRVDESTSQTATLISTDPTTVNDYERYRVTFTPTDANSPDAGSLRYEIRTGTGGTGTQLASGSASHNVPITTLYFNDAALTTGSNTRYIRIQDSGGNIAETSFTVTKALTRVWDQVTPMAVGGDDWGFIWATGAATTFGNTYTVNPVGWNASTARWGFGTRFVLDAEPAASIDYAMLRMAITTVNTADFTVRIRGVLELDPAAPLAAATVNAWTFTTAFVDWNVDQHTEGMPVETPDLSPILEELVAQPGWTAGNHIILDFRDRDLSSYPGNNDNYRRYDSYESNDTIPRFYVDWASAQTYDETTTTSSNIYSVETSDVEGILIDAIGGDHVIMGSVTTGSIDGVVYVDTDLVGEIPVRTDGVDLVQQYDLTDTPSLIYAESTSTIEYTTMLSDNDEGPYTVFTGGADVATFIETDGSVEAILEASSTLEDHDMYILDDVVVIEVYTSGFAGLAGDLDDSNPVTIYVETYGTDFFELGPQVYDETGNEIVVIYPEQSGEDTETMHDLLAVHVTQVYTDSSIEFFQGRFEEFNDPVVIPFVGTGSESMVMNASLEEVFEIPIVTDGFEVQHHFEPTGEIVFGFSATSSVETYVLGETGGIVLIEVSTTAEEMTGFLEMTGAVVIGVQTLADAGMLMHETEGSTIIGIVTSGYEGNLIEEFGYPVMIEVVTTGMAEERFIRQPSRYTRSGLIVEHPYEASTLRPIYLYSRSGLVSRHEMRESQLAAT